MSNEREAIDKGVECLQSWLKKNEILMEPFNYQLLRVPREELRTDIINGLNYWFQVPPHILQSIIEITNIMYNVVIISDDFEDNSQMRGGMPTAHRIFGLPVTYLSSNAGLLMAIKKVISLNNPKATDIFIDNILRFYYGQSKELYWKDVLACPTVNEYLELLSGKMEPYINIFLKLLDHFSTTGKRDINKFGKVFSILLQLQNDYSNFRHDEYWTTKSFGEDITEGKFTVPIIHAVRSGTSEGQIVLNILRQRTKDFEMKKYCIELMEKLGSLDFAKQLLDDFYKEVQEEIDKLGGNPKLDEVIAKFKAWATDEKYPPENVDKSYKNLGICN